MIESGYQIDLLAAVALVGIAQGLLLGLALTVSRRLYANRFLGLALTAISLGLLETFVIDTRVILALPHLAPAITFVDATYGPLFFLYVHSLTSPAFRWTKIHWLHFIPAFILFLLHVPYFFIPADTFRDIILTYYANLDAGNIEDDAIGLFVDIFIVALSLVYLVIGLRDVSKYEGRVRNSYSNVGKRSVVWLRMCLFALGILWLLWGGLTVVGSERWAMLLPLSGTVIIYVMFLIGFRRSELFHESVEDRPKYKNSPLLPDEAGPLKDQLVAVMRAKELYKDADLTLDQLAASVDQPPRLISQVLNEHMRQTFFDFVNSFRSKKRVICWRKRMRKSLTCMATTL